MNTKISQKKIGIIGGSGFVGSQLGRELIKNNQVFVLDLKECDYKAEYIKCDITNREDIISSTKDLDVLFHLGVNPNWHQNIIYPEVDYNISVLGTLNVLEACIKNNIKRLVFTSSVLVYGLGVKSPISENEKCFPTTPYGAAKLIAEKYINLYSVNYSISTVILRYFRVYGGNEIFYPNPRGVVASFIKKIANGDEITIHGDGNQALDFVHVEDVIKATISAASRETVGGVINIGSGQATSVNYLAETIADIYGNKIKKKYLNKNEQKNLQFTYEIPDAVGDISRAKEALDYTPKVKLKEGIKRTIEYFNSI